MNDGVRAGHCILPVRANGVRQAVDAAVEGRPAAGRMLPASAAEKRMVDMAERSFDDHHG
jgi:hypothetical protein